MGVIDWISNKLSVKAIREIFVESRGLSRSIYSDSFDGEKNSGAIGPLVNYKMDYFALRSRSWKAYLDSEIAQTAINKYRKWVIGSGLKLQALPNKYVLEQEGIKIDKELFQKDIENRFKVWGNSKMPCINSEKTLNQLSSDVFLNKIIAGDVLIVLRVIKGKVKIQIIDADHISSPLTYQIDSKGKIADGVEYDENGKTIAYHVRDPKNFLKTQRVLAYNNGFKVAWLYKGLTYRLDDRRGLPLISAVMETLTKLERYKEATVGSAEEVAKISYQVVHQAYSTGENPMSKQLAKSFGQDLNGPTPPVDEYGNALADKVASTTGKQAYNNPVGAEIKPMQSGNKELYFKDFYSVNIDLVCATLGIPPEIAMSLYRSNFSASRAALKDWEHTLGVERDDHKEQFLMPIYNLWLYVEVLGGKIKADGLVESHKTGNEMLFQAYTECRFVGANVPHIDPLKEVKAEREKLGLSGRNLPLTTLEQATETLNGGESDSNMENYATEYKKASELGIEVENKRDRNDGDLVD